MIVGEVAKFSENVLHPVWRVGDQGCKYDGNDVVTPPGWKEAYAQYVEGGWPTLPASAQYGGQEFPITLDTVKSEFCATANWTWFMYPMLSHGAVECMMAHASEDLKNMFLPKLVSGDWTGTMCLTEGHAGSDLGTIKTKAEPVGDGSYKISGTKIFISCGDADFSENIVHLVLAKLPNSPNGTKGISLFVVPKYMVKPDGSLDTSRKNALCVGIEHKMGIKGSATCVMAFEDSIGYLVGKENDGMRQMFSFMNTARLIVGVQGMGAAELSYQNALIYAKDRLAGRSPRGVQQPEKAADPIISQPDVRRMLLKLKAISEGGRCLVYHVALLEDQVRRATSAEEKHKAEAELGLLTPIVKAFLSETGFEVANDGLQVYGGHGYIGEWGMEQIVRDARIATLYEGTTGIQSMDLLGRKVMMDGGKALQAFCGDILSFCKKSTSPRAEVLTGLVKEWLALSAEIGGRMKKDPATLGSACVDFGFYSGYIVLAYMWLRMEEAASLKLQKNEGESDFLQAKIYTSQFYFNRLLPRTKSLAATVLAPTEDLMQIPEESFALE
eukprot:NODE_669_length_1995_cov_234.614080_g618_i0.p1 GENE.NODE_669_length_1995_cov_234.614080_g618_i0~~NODE_669_length_1995_cov_234.614080_g618_i0.p1  ORF type:complete len:626 (+),score=139.94 NODE_669_length_1995_cov_234.614080_g618_i0:212-1879(+)